MRKKDGAHIPLITFLIFGIVLIAILLLSNTATWAKTIKLGHQNDNAKVKARNLTADLSADSSGFVLTAWNGECSLSVSGLVASATRFYKRADGNLEWEIVVPFKLPSNSYAFPINTSGLVFYFQDSTEIANDPDLSCDDSVYNSWAVYHDSKRNNRRIINGIDTTYENYMAGKFCHIYRPKVFDDDGWTVWADLEFTETSVTITIPEDFRQNATYPIIIDPTVGYTTLGGADLTPTDYRHYINWDNSHTPTTGGDMDYAYVACKGILAHIAKVVSWTKGADCAGTDLHYTSNNITIADNSTAHWDSVVATGSFTTSTEYIVSIVGEDQGDGVYRFRLDTGGSDSKTFDDADMTPPADLTGCSDDATDYEYSGYISYTEAGGEEELNTRRRRILSENPVETDSTDSLIMAEFGWAFDSIGGFYYDVYPVMNVYDYSDNWGITRVEHFDRRLDINRDGGINILDATYWIKKVYKGM